MNLSSILLIAVGLAMDAFAVAVSAGVCIRHAKIHHMLKFGLFFGFFQFIMPILGYWGSQSFSSYVEAIDHIIACAVLVIIGGKMFYEALQADDTCPTTCDEPNMYSYKKLTLLAIATSIDALAVGISFAVTDTEIWSASLIIGVVAFTLSYLGVYIGKKLGCVFQKTAEKFGGIVLIAIGIKIFIENM